MRRRGPAGARSGASRRGLVARSGGLRRRHNGTGKGKTHVRVRNVLGEAALQDDQY
jgi:hypothetical protein